MFDISKKDIIKFLFAVFVLGLLYFIPVQDKTETPDKISSTNEAPIDYPEKIDITDEEVQLLAQQLIDDGFLPEPEFCVTPRPYTIQGERIAVDNNGINFLISQDPASPNGIDENDNPIIPQDLNPEQKEIYIDVLYGGTLDWKRIVRNPSSQEAKKTLGGCIYCNAPAGAGGCYKKQVLRGLVYNLVKQGWGREEIRQEGDVWMKCIFGPEPFLAWGVYYKKIGKDLNEIQATVDKLSLYGRSFVLSQLFSGDSKNSSGGSQPCGAPSGSQPCGVSSGAQPCGG